MREEQNVAVYYGQLLVLTMAAAAAGMLAGGMDAIFGIGLKYITEFRKEHTIWLLPLLPFTGVLLIWLYQKWGGDCKKGMGLVFETHDEKRDEIPLRLLPFAMGGTWLTHLTGGSVGREGVAVQMGCTISYNIGKRIPVRGAGKTLLVAGVAAGFAGLFRTPLAAVCFALELFGIGMLEIDALIPVMAAAFSANLTSGLLGMEKFHADIASIGAFDIPLVSRLIVLGIACGMTGYLFSQTIRRLKGYFGEKLKNPLVRIAIVGAVAAVLLLLCGYGRYAGASEELIEAAVGGKGTVYAWDFLAKLFFTALCIAGGFVGGEVAPMFAIGATLGAVLGGAMGMPPAFAAMLGYAAVFGAGTNTFFASVVVGAEIFGWHFFPYFFLVSSVAYACNRNRSIYPQHTFRELLERVDRDKE